MKRSLTIVGRVLGLLALVLVARTLVKEFGNIPSISLDITNVALLVLATSYWAVNVVFASYLWRLFLRDQGVLISERTAFWVVGVSQIAKYLPSNVLHFAGQVALSKRARVPTVKAVSSLAVQTGLTVLIPACLAVLGIIIEPGAWQSLTILRDNSLLGLTIVVAVALAGALVLFFARSLRQRLLRHIRQYRLSTFALASVLLVLSFIGHGFVLHLLSNQLWGLDQSPSWFVFTWGFALSWIAGFVIPGLPGGLGVREAVFAAVFGPALGPGLAVGLAVLLRVVSSVGDLLAFGLASTLTPRSTAKLELDRTVSS